MSLHGEVYERQLVWRHRLGQIFEWLCRLATWFSLGILAVLLLAIGRQAWGWLDAAGAELGPRATASAVQKGSSSCRLAT